MSKKRTSAEANDDEQQNEGSDSLLQQGNYAKHAKLDSLSDTTLQDLPMELIEFILIKVVVMEVKGMKLAKSVWKEKADLVINRLGTVCQYWNSILTTNFFRNELHRTLDTTGQQKIRLEILHQSQIPFQVLEVTIMKDEIFMFFRDFKIIVYNRNNMARLEDIVAPTGTFFLDIAGCNVSSCVYVLGRDTHDYSILRITKDEDHQFNITPWINSLSLPYIPSISVSNNGSLIILSWRQEENPANASIYDANGLLQNKIMLLPGRPIYAFRRSDNALLKSNGNLVLVYLNNRLHTELVEIDATGSTVSIERKYQSPVLAQSGVYSADISGRIVITELGDGIKLLDSELNLLDFTGPQLNASTMHYSSERNEIVSILSVGNNSSVLTIFRFTEE